MNIWEFNPFQMHLHDDESLRKIKAGFQRMVDLIDFELEARKRKRN